MEKLIEWFAEVLAEQPSAMPCIYRHGGKVDFSPGSTVGGAAEPVHSGVADVLLDAEEYRELCIYFTPEEIAGIVQARGQCLQ